MCACLSAQLVPLVHVILLTSAQKSLAVLSSVTALQPIVEAQYGVIRTAS